MLDIEIVSRPLHGLRLQFTPFPAMNRWAISSRPLPRTEPRHVFAQSRRKLTVANENGVFLLESRRFERLVSNGLFPS